MSLVCGIDFSKHAAHAVEAAAALAARSNQPLHLVHVLELGRSAATEALRAAQRGFAETQLAELAERARERCSKVEVHIEDGSPDEALLRIAQEVDAKLIVVAALGKQRDGVLLLGSHAERIAQRTHVPVLVVRDGEPFAAWARGDRPLRIVLGVDASQSSEHALRWIAELGALGPCTVTAVHMYWPPEQFERLGLHGIRSYLEPDAEVTRTLEQGFAARLRAHGIESPVLRALPHMGRIGDRLAAIARDERADLLVVGSHARGALGRIVEGSVSRDVLHCADVAVACIPAPAVPVPGPAPQLQQVLVACDFSPNSAAAISLAHAIVAPGGVIHLVHVVPENRATSPTTAHDIFTPPEAHAPDRVRLAQLAVGRTSDRAVRHRLHVLESDDVAAAICQAAERLDASVVCLGRRGHGLSTALLGSVAHAVVGGTQRPVLLAREPLQ